MAGQFDRIVLPGESGKIPIKINSKHGGPVSKSINVYTNVEGVDATIRLKLKGTVWEAVQLTPRSASFGRLASAAIEGGKGKKMLAVVNNVEGEMKLTNIKSSNPIFAAEVKETVPGKKAEITVSIVKPLSQGSNRGTIEMQTGIKDMPSLKISVSAHLAPELEVRPQQFTLYPDRQSTRPYSVLVSNNGKTPLKITNLAVSNPDFKVELSEKKPGEMFGITLELPKDYKLTGNDRVTFSTNHPSFPSMVVPITERHVNPAGGNISQARGATRRAATGAGAANPTAPASGATKPAIGDSKAGAPASAQPSVGEKKGASKASQTGGTAARSTATKDKASDSGALSPTRKSENDGKDDASSGKAVKLSPADKAKVGSTKSAS